MAGLLISFFTQSNFEMGSPVWTLFHIYEYDFDRSEMPISSIDDTFYDDWNQEIEALIKRIGYLRYLLASLIPAILYLICLPILLLGELQLDLQSIPTAYLYHGLSEGFAENFESILTIPIRALTTIPMIIGFSLQITVPWILGSWFDSVSHDLYLKRHAWDSEAPWLLALNILPTIIGTV